MEPEAVRNIMASELAMAREKGYMNTSFHGDNAVFLFLGAWERGIEFDYAAAYEYLRKNATDPKRSEEHTSELQSLMRISYAVFCLKKKKTKKNTPQTKTT